MAPRLAVASQSIHLASRREKQLMHTGAQKPQMEGVDGGGKAY
jgi:hypothetical protein